MEQYAILIHWYNAAPDLMTFGVFHIECIFIGTNASLCIHTVQTQDNFHLRSVTNKLTYYVMFHRLLSSRVT